MNAAMKAGSEPRELKRRTRGGRRRAHDQKRICCTAAPYGMIYLDKFHPGSDGKSQYFKEDPVESSVAALAKRTVVENVFHWRFYNRLRICELVRRLNEAGILSAGYWVKGGVWVPPGPWTRQTIQHMLKNRSYMGEHVEGGDVFECPKFVEPEVWEGVQEMWVEAKAMHMGGDLAAIFSRASCAAVSGAATTPMQKGGRNSLGRDQAAPHAGRPSPSERQGLL